MIEVDTISQLEGDELRDALNETGLYNPLYYHYLLRVLFLKLYHSRKLDCIYGETKEKANTHRDALRITVKKMRNIERIPAKDIAIIFNISPRKVRSLLV
jgi:hypothetical protein